MTQKFAQDWLDETYPENTRGDIQHKITIRNAFSGVPLEGTLRLVFPRVKQIDCALNAISSLILDCSELEELEAHSNQIRTIEFLSSCPLLTKVELKNNLLTEISLLNFFNLTVLNLDNNYLTSIDLTQNTNLVYLSLNNNGITADMSMFSSYKDLQKLYLGIFYAEQKLGTKQRNNFTGSLENLKKCIHLEELDIDKNENLFGGLEFLPSYNLKGFWCYDTSFYWILKKAGCPVGSAGVRKWQELDYEKKEKSIKEVMSKKTFEAAPEVQVQDEKEEKRAWNEERNKKDKEEKSWTEECEKNGITDHKTIRNFIATQRETQFQKYLEKHRQTKTQEYFRIVSEPVQYSSILEPENNRK